MNLGTTVKKQYCTNVQIQSGFVFAFRVGYWAPLRLGCMKHVYFGFAVIGFFSHFWLKKQKHSTLENRPQFGSPCAKGSHQGVLSVKQFKA